MVAARDPEELYHAARADDRAALARLLSLVERGGTASRQIARLAWRDGQPDHVVGVTGAPGAGKSTLTDKLIAAAKPTTRLSVLAIDPSSPFTGGAILGDRVRMQDHALDGRVFVRSMATRGHLGGLALAAPEAIRTLAACGYPTVLVETVGVGQVEVEIAGAADTTVVVVNPGWGDAIQAAKAGLLEIADVFVVNKADRPGAVEAKRDLEAMLDMSARPERPPVLTTVATTGDGVSEVWAAIRSHREQLQATQELGRRRDQQLLDEVDRIVTERLRALTGRALNKSAQDALLARRIDPYEAADLLLEGLSPGHAAQLDG